MSVRRNINWWIVSGIALLALLTGILVANGYAANSAEGATTTLASNRTHVGYEMRTMRVNKAAVTPCEEEDSRNCYWYAGGRGNNVGTSFVNFGRFKTATNRGMAPDRVVFYRNCIMHIDRSGLRYPTNAPCVGPGGLIR